MVKDITDIEIVVAPPPSAAAEAARSNNVVIAAQDCTGARGALRQVSAQMVREAGAEYVIIGHLSDARCSARPTPGEPEDRGRVRGRRQSSASRASISDRNETLAVLDRQITRGSRAHRRQRRSS
jgi:hypothetical protein